MAFTESRALRIPVSLVAGAFVWQVALASTMGLLRLAWPDYDAAYPDRAYTLSMLLTRLVVFSGVIAATSATAAVVARDRRLAWVAGLVILGFSIPPHLYPGHIWAEYPAWYHYAYLVLIVPVAVAAGTLVAPSRRPLRVEPASG